jgi:hypothetical protein
MRVRMWLGCAAFAACGGASPQTSATAPRAAPHAEVKTYAPLQFGGDARAPTSAVILGIDDNDRSLVMPLVPPPPAPTRVAARSDDSARAALAVAHALDKDVAEVTAYVDAAPRGPAVAIAVSALAQATGWPVIRGAPLEAHLALDGTLVASQASAPPLDLAEAYELATGKHLPQAAPVPASALAIDRATLAQLDARYQQWLHHLAGDWAAVLELDSAGRLPAAVAAVHELAHHYAERAMTAHQQGKIIAAYAAVRRAIVYADAAAAVSTLRSEMRSGNADGARRSLFAPAEDVDPAGTLSAVVDARPTTLLGAVALAAAERDLEESETAWGLVFDGVERLHQLDLKLTVEKDVTVPEGANQYGDGLEQFAYGLVSSFVARARSRLALEDAKFELARTSLTGPACACRGVSRSYLANVDPLAAARAYGVTFDRLGRPTSIHDDAGFAKLLATAERHARAGAHAARVATGDVPLEARIAYQLAIIDREGELADRLDALAELWAASEVMNTAIELARQR